MNVKVDKPYPKVQVEKKNYYYASLLKQDYTGDVSELTAILLYSYQHIIKDKTLEEIAKIIHEISIVEMLHLELLGETITLLGGNADFSINNPINYQKEYWNASLVNYETDIKKILKIDIESEKKAIINYQKHYLMIEDKYIRSLLERIIEDEKRHLVIFKILLENLNS